MRMTLREARSVSDQIRILDDIDRAIARPRKWKATDEAAASGGPDFAPDLMLVLPDGELDVGELLPYDAYEGVDLLYERLNKEVVDRNLDFLEEARAKLIACLETELNVDLGSSGS